VTVTHVLSGRSLGNVLLDDRWTRAFLDALDAEHHLPSEHPCRDVCGDSLGAADVIRLEFREGKRVAELGYRLGYGQLRMADTTVCCEVRDRHARFLALVEQALPRDHRVHGVELCPPDTAPGGRKARSVREAGTMVEERDTVAWPPHADQGCFSAFDAAALPGASPGNAPAGSSASSLMRILARMGSPANRASSV